MRYDLHGCRALTSALARLPCLQSVSNDLYQHKTSANNTTLLFRLL